MKYSKKWLLLASAFFLFACNGVEVNNEVVDNHYVNESDKAVYENYVSQHTGDLDAFSENSELEFSLDVLTDEEFAELENYIVADYLVIRGLEYSNNGLTIHFNFNQSVYGFSLVSLANIFSDNHEFVATGIIHEVGHIYKDTVFTLINYLEIAKEPITGFFFFDSNGSEHWYAINQVQENGRVSVSSFDWNSDYFVNSFSFQRSIDFHKVLEGETLSYIAQQHKTTIEEIKSLNNLGIEETIQIGEFLVVPILLSNDRDIFSAYHETKWFQIASYIYNYSTVDQWSPLRWASAAMDSQLIIMRILDNDYLLNKFSSYENLPFCIENPDSICIDLDYILHNKFSILNPFDRAVSLSR